MLKLDSHQHFWIFDALRDSWITDDMEVLRQDFLPGDLQPLLDQNGISGCVAVHADQSEAETVFLLDLADQHDFIKGVVGWVDLQSADLRKRLDHYSKFPKLRGFRHVVQAEPSGFMLQADFLRGIAALKDYGYTYDILIRAHQLREAINLVERNPRQLFVIDHLAKPNIRTGEISSWAFDIYRLASFQNVYCKLSGMVTEADLRAWTYEDIYPYLSTILQAFGPDRVMFGSDWPVCRLAADYREVHDLLHEYVHLLDQKDQDKIWAENAIEFYGLKGLL
jgi:L-fuconolactonase